jgi:hypothetical protein
MPLAQQIDVLEAALASFVCGAQSLVPDLVLFAFASDVCERAQAVLDTSKSGCRTRASRMHERPMHDHDWTRLASYKATIRGSRKGVHLQPKPKCKLCS